jgi:hypothetical protein
MWVHVLLQGGSGMPDPYGGLRCLRRGEACLALSFLIDPLIAYRFENRGFSRSNAHCLGLLMMYSRVAFSDASLRMMWSW